MLDNPRYAERMANYSHLIGVELEDQSLERGLPVHIILGANEYTQIRTRTRNRVLDDVENMWLNLLVLVGLLWRQE